LEQLVDVNLILRLMMINQYMFKVTNPAKEQIEAMKKGVKDSIEQSSQIHNTDMVVNYDKYYQRSLENEQKKP